MTKFYIICGIVLVAILVGSYNFYTWLLYKSANESRQYEQFTRDNVVFACENNEQNIEWTPNKITCWNAEDGEVDEYELPEVLIN